MSRELLSKAKPTRILSKSALRYAWSNSRDATSKPGASGSDEITARGFSSNLDLNLDRLATEIRKGAFNFSKLRPVPIPKGNSGKERLICIPTVRDRLVQRTLANHLQKRRLLPIYNASSFGFIPEQGLKKAINRTLELRENYDFVFETDIQKFFDKVDRNQLIEITRKSLRGSSILPLLEKVIRTEVKTTPFCDNNKLKQLGIQNGIGIRQGMPLSPLLANLALSEFDKAIHISGIPMVRYADDIVTFSNTREGAMAAYRIIQSLLANQGLTIPDLAEGGKTQISAKRMPFDFLGRTIAFSNQRGVYVQKISNEKVEKIKNQIFDDFSYEKVIRGSRSFIESTYLIRRKINSYISSYSDADNIINFEKEMKFLYNNTMLKIYESIFGHKSIRNLRSEQKVFVGLNEEKFETMEVDYF